jgi:hypothetical protein
VVKAFRKWRLLKHPSTGRQTDMAASDFFSRWSKRGAEKEMTQEAVSDSRLDQLAVVTTADASDPGKTLEQVAERAPDKVPDMADVAALRDESDFSRFMAKDVDESVRRSAMKNCFPIRTSMSWMAWIFILMITVKPTHYRLECWSLCCMPRPC